MKALVSQREGSQAGFSSLEVLQTLSILAVGLLGLSSLTLGTARGNAHAQRITSAAVLAQDKVEELRRADFAAITAGEDQISLTGISYARTWQVCVDCPVTGAKEVTVSVVWNPASNHAVQMQTIVARP